jgi:hypothetical protein
MVTAIFTLLVLYQLKHFLADYPLQTKYMLGKFKPGRDFVGPLLAHVAVHFAGTLAIGYYFLPVRLWNWVWLIAAFDFTVHFAMDRIKAGPKYMGRWKAITAQQYLDHATTLKASVGTRYFDSKGGEWTFYEKEDLEQAQTAARKSLRGNTLFWWALGFDQMVHHLTHYVCIYAFLRVAGWF